jgi:hypothetical protein
MKRRKETMRYTLSLLVPAVLALGAWPAGAELPVKARLAAHEVTRERAVTSARTERSVVRLAQLASQEAGVPAGSAPKHETGEIRGTSGESIHEKPGPVETDQEHGGLRDPDHDRMHESGLHGDHDAISDSSAEHDEGHGEHHEGEDLHHGEQTGEDMAPNHDQERLHEVGMMGGETGEMMGPGAGMMGGEATPGGPEQMHGGSHGAGMHGGPEQGETGGDNIGHDHGGGMR